MNLRTLPERFEVFVLREYNLAQIFVDASFEIVKKVSKQRFQ